MSTTLLLSVLLAALCLKVDAFSTYKDKIPNGNMVPNPCNRSTIWAGVGHQAVFGAGPRNQFGLDFLANNKTWNPTLCMMDSDGDGMTNGQELGDPNCIWMVGSTPTASTNLTHPGVCEPIGSPQCSTKNSWLMNCMPGKFNCSAKDAPGVRNATLRFPPTPIPAKETTYICQRYRLPNDSVADIIAIEPILDNARILHHMLLYACTDEPKDIVGDQPFECGMGSAMSCQSLIGIWGVGGLGQCLNSQMGFRIGPGGFQYAVLQLHWNNPGNMTNLMDASGMRIHYTNELRPNRGQVLMAGQNYLEIPPRQSEVKFMGGCSSLCTRHLPRSVFITSSTLHMHSLGKSGDIRLIRNGMLVKMLDNVPQYDYNTPTFSEFETPIELKPGDEIQVNCVYDSTKKNSTTMYGEATSDEMCFGFFAYYPLIQGLSYCGQWKSVNICNGKFDTEFESCEINSVMKLLYLLPTVCAENCTSTHCAVIMDGIQATGCNNFPDVKKFIHFFLPSYSEIFGRCAMERPPKSPNPPCAQGPVSNSPGQSASLGFGFVFTLMAYAASR